MGWEVETDVEIEGQQGFCLVLLESMGVVCRRPVGRTFRRGEIKGLRADGDWILFDYAGQAIRIKLYEQSEAWVKRIESPRTRAQKLGLSPGTAVSLLGDIGEEAVREMEAATGMGVRREVSDAGGIVVLVARRRDDLSTVRDVGARLLPGAALWVLWPKGSSVLSHRAVVDAAASGGLASSRSVGFSEELTGLRFVPSPRQVAREESGPARRPSASQGRRP